MGDEMITVAKEMSKRGMTQPLLIGGATTSKMHTAVKVSPMYSTPEHPVIHVLDASRSVGVVSSLLNDQKEEFVEALMEEYDELREDYYAGLENRAYVDYASSIDQRYCIDFKAVPPPKTPNQLGSTVIVKELDEVLPFIDWNPFFQTWELRGRYPNRGYPKIFDDEKVGSEAKKLFGAAQDMLKEIVAEKTMRLKGVVGIFPANRTDGGEDVEVYTDQSRTEVKTTFCMLR